MKRILALMLIAATWFVGESLAQDSNAVTMAQAYSETLKGNYDIVIARKDLERAAGTKIELRARDLANATLESSVGYRKGDLYGNGGPFALFTAEISQPLLNGAIIPLWRRGQGEVLLAEQKLNVAISDRLQDEHIFYLRAQRLRQLIALNEELGARLENNITAEKQRQSVGSTGPLYLLQARVQSLSQNGQLISLKREQFDVLSQWADAMNRTQDHLPHPVGDLAREPVNPDWKKLTQVAIERRADLRLLRALIQNAKNDQAVVQAGYYPSISLIASGLYIPGKTLLYQTSQIVQGQTPYGSEVRYGVGATWQIIDNGSVTGVSREIRAIWQQYEIILKELEEGIPRELSRISHELEDADAKLSALNQSVKQADENLRLVESRVSLGLATQFDFSDAQRNLLAVRTGVVEALFQYEIAVARLDWVTGRYLEFAEPERRR